MSETYHITLALLSRLVTEGRVYTLGTTAGTFLVAKASALPLKALPERFDRLTPMMRHPEDFPLWCPLEQGRDSPWGKGIPSINLYYLFPDC